MISSISTSCWLVLNKVSTWLIFSGSAAGTLELARMMVVVWSGASPPVRGCAIGLNILRLTPFCSMARITPRLTLVRPTLVPVGINIIVRDTAKPLWFARRSMTRWGRGCAGSLPCACTGNDGDLTLAASGLATLACYEKNCQQTLAVGCIVMRSDGPHLER